MEKLLGASKLEVEKYQSIGGFYATVAKTLKENIVKGLGFFSFLWGDCFFWSGLHSQA